MVNRPALQQQEPSINLMVTNNYDIIISFCGQKTVMKIYICLLKFMGKSSCSTTVVCSTHSSSKTQDQEVGV